MNHWKDKKVQIPVNLFVCEIQLSQFLRIQHLPNGPIVSTKTMIWTRLNTEDGTNRFFWDVGTYLTSYAVSHLISHSFKRKK